MTLIENAGSVNGGNLRRILKNKQERAAVHRFNSHRMFTYPVCVQRICVINGGCGASRHNIWHTNKGDNNLVRNLLVAHQKMLLHRFLVLVDIGVAVDGAPGSVDQVVGPIVNNLLIEYYFYKEKVSRDLKSAFSINEKRV